jgi:hypothetical protein
VGIGVAIAIVQVTDDLSVVIELGNVERNCSLRRRKTEMAVFIVMAAVVKEIWLSVGHHVNPSNHPNGD